jgi:transcriptional regulator GlxA family with amidase domain
MAGMQTVAVIVQDGAEPFGLGSLVEVWGEDFHPDDDNPVFDFRVCTPRPGRVKGRSDYDIHVDRGLEATLDADLVCLAPKHDFMRFDDDVRAAIVAAHERGAIIYAHCSGVFELGNAGLLDGRECTTHWRYTDLLENAFPEAKVRPDVLYCHDGNVLTGAGSAAGIDASLHLMRDLYGAHVAATTARRIVVPPHRDGGQAQFISRPVVDCDAETLGPLLQWILEHLADELDVDTLARKSLMSPRTFARRFRAETGATPHSWVTKQRVLRAEQLLEQSDRSVEWIASDVGFGNAATLRHHFTRSRGVSPQQYRRTFSGVA